MSIPSLTSSSLPVYLTYIPHLLSLLATSFLILTYSNYPDKTNRRNIRLALTSGVDRKVFVKTRASWRLSKKAQENMHRSDPKVHSLSFFLSLPSSLSLLPLVFSNLISFYPPPSSLLVYTNSAYRRRQPKRRLPLPKKEPQRKPPPKRQLLPRNQLPKRQLLPKRKLPRKHLPARGRRRLPRRAPLPRNEHQRTMHQSLPRRK